MRYVEVQGRRLCVVDVDPSRDRQGLGLLLRRAGLPLAVPVVVLVGGAGGLEDGERRACADLLAGAVLPALEAAGGVLVDGGTDAGVMRLAGRTRRAAGFTFPLVGVVARGTVRWPHEALPPDSGPGIGRPAALEPNHTHVVAVPGSRWGDETPWLDAVADALAAGEPSVTVLANGGGIALRDVRRSIDAGRPALVLSGTGRAADRLAAVVADPGTAAEQAGAQDMAALASSPLLRVVPPDLAAARRAIAAALDG